MSADCVCSVCLGVVENNDDKCITNCGHNFHTSCFLIKWKKNGTKIIVRNVGKICHL